MYPTRVLGSEGGRVRSHRPRPPSLQVCFGVYCSIHPSQYSLGVKVTSVVESRHLTGKGSPSEPEVLPEHGPRDVTLPDGRDTVRTTSRRGPRSVVETGPLTRVTTDLRGT